MFHQRQLLNSIYIRYQASHCSHRLCADILFHSESPSTTREFANWHNAPLCGKFIANNKNPINNFCMRTKKAFSNLGLSHRNFSFSQRFVGIHENHARDVCLLICLGVCFVKQAAAQKSASLKCYWKGDEILKLNMIRPKSGEWLVWRRIPTNSTNKGKSEPR